MSDYLFDFHLESFFLEKPKSSPLGVQSESLHLNGYMKCVILSIVALASRIFMNRIDPSACEKEREFPKRLVTVIFPEYTPLALTLLLLFEPFLEILGESGVVSCEFFLEILMLVVLSSLLAIILETLAGACGSILDKIHCLIHFPPKKLIDFIAPRDFRALSL